MPRRDDIESILLIGSGPIVIGQACEFDYSGTQACRVLREEGYRVILANSNPATIMTDPDFADATYVEPLDVDVLTRIIERERPDAVLPTLGGQTALNLAMELVERGVLDALRRRADRRQRRGHRHRRGPRAVQGGDAGDRPRRCPPSGTAHTMDEAREVVGRDRPAGRHPPRLHPRRPGHRHRLDAGGVRAAWPRPASTPARSPRSSSSSRSRAGRSSSSRSCGTAPTTA